MCELDLHVVYKPSVANIAADTLYHYGWHVDETGDISIVKHSLADV